MFIYGLDKSYSLDHFTRNRQRKLLYVALSRARSSIHLYLNYSVESAPPLLHLALEGSILKYRFLSAMNTGRTVAGAITDGSGASNSKEVYNVRRVAGRNIPTGNLSISVECTGMNKENCGGLSGSELEVDVIGDHIIPASLDITQHVNMDTISRHLVSKVLIYEALTLWTTTTVSTSAVSNCASKTVASVGRMMKETNKSWEVNQSILSQQSTLKCINESAVQFGLGAIATLLSLCNEQTSHSSYDFPSVDPSQLYDRTTGRFCLVAAETASRILGVLLEGFASRFRDVSLETNTFKSMTFGSNRGKICVRCAPDMVFSVSTLHIPVALCTLSSRHAIVRASLCGTILNCKFSVIINSTTGKLLVVKPSSPDQMECIAKGNILSKYVCEWSSQCIPISLVPLLDRSVSVVILSTGRHSCGTASLCVLLMSNFTLTSAEKWDLPADRHGFKALVLSRCVKEWIDTRIREECCRLVHCDSVTLDLLGDILNPERAVSLTALFSTMADALATTGNRSSLVQILRTKRESSLDWCTSILNSVCCSFAGIFDCENCHDVNIAVGCTLKALVNWDTAV